MKKATYRNWEKIVAFVSQHRSKLQSFLPFPFALCIYLAVKEDINSARSVRWISHRVSQHQRQSVCPCNRLNWSNAVAREAFCAPNDIAFERNESTKFEYFFFRYCVYIRLQFFRANVERKRSYLKNFIQLRRIKEMKFTVVFFEERLRVQRNLNKR